MASAAARSRSGSSSWNGASGVATGAAAGASAAGAGGGAPGRSKGVSTRGAGGPGTPAGGASSKSASSPAAASEGAGVAAGGGRSPAAASRRPRSSRALASSASAAALRASVGSLGPLRRSSEAGSSGAEILRSKGRPSAGAERNCFTCSASAAGSTGRGSCTARSGARGDSPRMMRGMPRVASSSSSWRIASSASPPWQVAPSRSRSGRAWPTEASASGALVASSGARPERDSTRLTAVISEMSSSTRRRRATLGG